MLWAVTCGCGEGVFTEDRVPSVGQKEKGHQVERTAPAKAWKSKGYLRAEGTE